MAPTRGLPQTTGLPEENGAVILTPNSQPSLQDLHSVAQDIKNTLTAALTAAITDLKIDIQAIAGRVQEVEKTTTTHSTVLRRTCQALDTHTLQLRDMNRHLEDLDNRGRRHNLRVRGLPESIEADRLQAEISSFFNSLLDKPPTTPIGMERIHRALRPRGREADPPRDVICHIIDYHLKEELLRKARLATKLSHNGADIRIFQDLSTITLQRRRELRPLLEVLRSKDIAYRWKFPFGLSASYQGRTALLRVPEDLRYFCETLDLPFTDVPEWYAEFRPPASRRLPPDSEPMDTQPHRYRRQRSPSETGQRLHGPGTARGPSPLDTPQTRRARRDR